MANKLINIKDEETIIIEDKFFESLKYVEEIKSKLKNNDFFNVIGLYGAWGIGKSSIIKTVINDCKSEYTFVEYDAWKYNEECIKRIFLLELMKKTNYPKKEAEKIRKRLYEESIIENDVKENYSFIKEITLISLFLFCAFIVKSTISFALVISVIGYAIKLFDRYVEKKKLSSKLLPIKSIEEYEEIYKKIIEKGAKDKRVIVIIDNLDRCNADMSYRMLTELKTFMSQEERVTIIIPLDEEAIKSHVKKSLHIGDCEANEYLIKIINSSIYIKEPSSEKMYRYISELCEKNSIILKEQTKIVISELKLNNPRKIINVINNLINELNIFSKIEDAEIKEKNEYLFVIVLYVKEQFPEIYKKIKNRETPSEEELDKNLKFPKTLEKYFFQKNVNIMYYIVHHEMGYITKFTPEERKNIIDKESFENINQNNIHELLTKIINEIRSGISMNSELSKKITFINYEKMIEILNNHDEDNYLYEEFYELSKKIPRSTNPIPLGAPATKDTFYSNIKNKEQYIKYAIRCYKNGKNDILEQLFSFIEKEKEEDMILRFIKYNKEDMLYKNISKTVTLKAIESPTFIQKINKALVPIIFDYTNLKTYTEAFMNENVCIEDYKYLIDNLSNKDVLVKEEEFSNFLDFFIFKINHAILFPSNKPTYHNILSPINDILEKIEEKSTLEKSKPRLVEILYKLKGCKDFPVCEKFYNEIERITDDKEIINIIYDRTNEYNGELVKKRF